MKKDAVLIAALLIVVAALFLLFIFYDSSGKNKNAPERATNPPIRNTGRITGADDNLPVTDSSGSPKPGNAGGRGEGGGNSYHGNSGNETEAGSDSTCIIARPGNLPGISCYVNKITENSVSIKIRNDLGESINAIIKIDTCTPDIKETIENSLEKDFVFSCSNSGYFNQPIHLSYILSSGQADIGGFVSGNVV